MTTETAFYWLIERGPALNHVPTVWWIVDDRWTQDAYAAHWFDTKADAEAAIAHRQRINRPPWAIAVEHGFEQVQPLTQPGEPTTAAGRALDQIPTHHFRSHELRVSSCDYALTPNGQCTCGLTGRIIAIEREAIANYLSDPATALVLAKWLDDHDPSNPPAKAILAALLDASEGSDE